MKKFLVLVLLFGCLNEPALNQAVTAFEIVHGPVTEHCLEYARGADVGRVGQDELQQRCRTDVLVDGCAFGASATIWILDEASNEVEAHELLHVLLHCETGSGDGSHSDRAWNEL